MLLNACGNGEVQVKNTSEAIEKISIEIPCTTPTTLSNYVELKSGDTIVKDEVSSSIKLYHDENNLKRVCLQSGKAHVERAI
ncbi:MAG: Unknown protein [uncultured Sulfurovum sp.]|uniref:Uncharacterized protein n=1 Tax=uncultured Sulfurovum sp. TaxID=269237 RepID=A0A6S6SC40_9BACT|nr:MAG: Unknown protein [uncultured Sulfurovum sp.]